MCRFVPLHSVEASTETWTLKIQRPELADTGEYEFQVVKSTGEYLRVLESTSARYWRVLEST